MWLLYVDEQQSSAYSKPAGIAGVGHCAADGKCVLLLTPKGQNGFCTCITKNTENKTLYLNILYLKITIHSLLVITAQNQMWWTLIKMYCFGFTSTHVH